MMKWHYQLIKHVYPENIIVYSVHEYYPDIQDGGEAWTLNPVDIVGDNTADISWLLDTIQKDIEKYGVKEIVHDKPLANTRSSIDGVQ